jgi:hypothetical protein
VAEVLNFNHILAILRLLLCFFDLSFEQDEMLMVELKLPFFGLLDSKCCCSPRTASWSVLVFSFCLLNFMGEELKKPVCKRKNAYFYSLKTQERKREK